MSDFKFSCPNCDQHLNVDDGWAGHQIACPGCQSQIRVPEAPTVRNAGGVEVAGATPPEMSNAGASSGKEGGKTGLILAIVGAIVVIGGGVGGFLFLKSKGGDGGGPTDAGPSTASENAAAGAEPGDGGEMNFPVPAASSGAAKGSGFPTEFSWPQWRGPNRDGLSGEKGLATQWPDEGPPLVWKATGCGKGFSSVAVAGGRVYTMGDGSGSSSAHCFDENTGAKVWSSKPLGRTGGNYAGTKSTPTVDGNRVYVLGQFGDLVCLNAGDGSEVWRKNLVSDFSGKFSQWNYAESPLIDGEKLVVSPGGRAGLMLALNKSNGSPIWRTGDWREEVQYVSSIVSNLGGRKNYIQLTQQTLAGVDAETGRIVWRFPRKGATAVIPTPVVYNNIVFVTSGYNVGCNAFQVSGSGGRASARQIYASKEMVNHHGGVVLVDKYVYGHSDRGGWKCLDVTTGRVMWSDNGVRKGSVVYADGHLYCRSEESNGMVALVEATPEGYREKSRFRQPDRSRDKSWAHPVVVNGKLFLRDQDVLLCFDVRG